MTQNHHFLCPVCRHHLTLTDKTAVCPQGHNFDRARQGYLNLLLKPAKTLYTKNLYLARRQLCSNGVFDPLIASLSALLLQHTAAPNPALLDAGCGDGSLLTALDRSLRNHGRQPTALGIDISKDAVRIAAGAAPGLTWCVADLARLPVADHSQDIIMNILAPANYSEFSRLLRANGVLIKVLPGPEHFKEIREAMHLSEPPPAELPTITHTESSLTTIASHRLTYDVSTADNIEAFIQMSPLSWHAQKETRESALNCRLSKIRLDYMLILQISIP